jgi:beta-glucosidase-like glycosyl hydrolase
MAGKGRTEKEREWGGEHTPNAARSIQHTEFSAAYEQLAGVSGIAND